MFANYLRMEFFRLSKMKALVVLPIVLVAVMTIQTFFLLRFNIEGALFSAVTTTVGISTSSAEKGMFSGGEGYNNTVAQTFEANIHGMMIILIIAIMAALFFGSDYATHTTKNYPLINGKRWVRVTSQMIVMAAFVMATFIITWIISFICNLIWARSLRLGISGRQILFFLTAYIAAMAFVSVICLLVTLTKSRGAGMTFGILIAIGILNVPITIIDYYLKLKGIVKDLSLNYLFPARILEKVGTDASGKVVIITTICAIIYLTLTYIGSVKISSKRDLDT